MVKTAALNGLSKLAAASFNFAVVVILSRGLGAEARGQCGWYLVVIALVLVLSEVLAGSAVVFLMQHFAWQQIRRLHAFWSLAVSLAVSAGCLALGKLHPPEAAWIVLAAWLNALWVHQQHILLGLGKNVKFLWLQFIAPAFILTGVWIIVQMRLSGALAYLWALSAGWGLGVLWGLYWLPLWPVKQRQNYQSWCLVFKSAVKYGAVNQVAHGFGILNNRLAYYLLPATLLGVYSNALALAEAMLLLPGSLGQIMYAQIARMPQSHDKLGVLRQAFWVNASLMLLGACLVFLIPDALYTWLFGPDFAGVKTYLMPLGLAMVLYSTYLILSYYHSAQGLFKLNIWPLLGGLLASGCAAGLLKVFSPLNAWKLVLVQAGSYAIIAFVSLGILLRRQPGAFEVFRFPYPAKIWQFMRQLLRGGRA